MKEAIVRRAIRVLFLPAVLVLAVGIMPQGAAAYGRGIHTYIAREAAALYEDNVGIFPALQANLDVIAEHGAKHEDETDHIWDNGGYFVTCTHFWEADNPNLSENNWVVERNCGNAYMKANELFDASFESYFANDYYQWWEYLGHIVHLIGDMTVPAHAHVDLHVSFDSYDDCAAGELYPSFTAAEANSAGGVVEIPEAAIQWIIDHEAQGGGYGLSPAYPRPYAQLYYLMYTAAQTGDYFASDDDDGDSEDRHGWMDYSGMPPGSPRTEDDLDDNWWYDAGEVAWYCDNYDGDYTRIAQTSIVYGMRASAALYHAFRDAFDGNPAASMADLTYAVPPPYSDWTNAPVTVALSAEEDISTLYVSGVYEIQWRETGSFEQYTEPIVISEEGIHGIQYWSRDWFGNREQAQTTIVKIDLTPPEITFPDLKPLYLTSENFVAAWTATDALSGIHSEYALLDGQAVAKGQLVDLALLAGMHRLEVYAEDEAGNVRYAYYDFEVAIDADGTCRPVRVSNNTSGNAVFCLVEFPAPYNVGMIDYTTCTLDVNSAALSADHITGVGNYDGDDALGRMLRFNKKEFVGALGSQVGDIAAEIWGGLFPNGMPRFVADLTIEVFDPSN